MKHDKIKIVLYWLTRILQRVSLFNLGIATIVYWVVNVAIALDLSFAGAQKNAPVFNDPQDTQKTVELIQSTMNTIIIQALVIASVATIIFLAFKRVRTNEKRLLVDSVVFISFCLVSVVLATFIIRSVAMRIALN